VPVFIVIGVVGLVIVLASLILGEIFDGLFDALDLDAGSGLFSAPVIGSFLAAFGFGAALTMFSTGIGAVGGSLAGLGSGAVIGGAALMMTRALINMPTDDPVRTSDLVGRTAIVVTPIPENGMGEVSLTHAGHVMKLSARGPGMIPAGTTVIVETVTSSTSVMVKPAPPH
jgi:membrane protein implicated in regulation of membrane protease activity